MENNFICYLDLLGIRETAKFSADDYFESMKSFLRKLIVATKSIPEDDEARKTSDLFKLHFFSDCCFIESKEITLIFDYLIELRKRLFQDEPLFFSAAISIGKLESLNIGLQSKKIDKSTPPPPFNEFLDLVEQIDASNFLNGTIFQSKTISKVYLLQAEFKGSGIFIDPECLKVWRNNFEDIDSYRKQFQKYISESFYFPSIHTNTVKGYYDLKISNLEMNDYTFKTISKKYYYSNAKNKKYGRFYLPILANWIFSENYDCIETTKYRNKVSIKNEPLIVSYLINKDEVVSELIKNAFYFEYLYFFLLKKVYEDRKTSDDVTQFFVENFIFKNPKCKKYLTNIDNIPDSILDSKNKHNLIEDYHAFLHNRNKAKTKGSKQK